jgi:predicted  nucleic acid-binding Zn-ribbon protein
MQGQCQHCAGIFEYETGSEYEFCPHCGKKTYCLTPRASKRSFQSIIAWTFAAIFAVTSILFASLYLSEKHSLQRTETALDMTEKSEAELRSNVQAAIDAQDKQGTQAAAQDNVSELAAEGRQALSGIYYCQQAVGKNELDMRSDGSAVWLNEGSNQNGWPATWTTDGDTITVITGSRTENFKIEGADLIDARGNRWLHIR